MFNVGGGELLVILLLALIVLGPQRLPGAVRTAGRVMGEVRRISSGFQNELKTAFDEADVDAEPPRRREAVPLAAAVAEVEAADRPADRDHDPDRDDRDHDLDRDDHVHRGAPATAGPVPADTVAPAVRDALDEIVTPLTPPSADPSEPSAGGERAAS
jgi:sec-independent protein translocase protein TatB